MDWNARLTRAEKRGEFTDKDQELAMRFATCAVGEHRGEYKEATCHPGCPASGKLMGLGSRFATNDVVAARALYDRIQAWFRHYGKRAA